MYLREEKENVPSDLVCFWGSAQEVEELRTAWMPAITCIFYSEQLNL